MEWVCGHRYGIRVRVPLPRLFRLPWLEAAVLTIANNLIDAGIATTFKDSC